MEPKKRKKKKNYYAALAEEIGRMNTEARGNAEATLAKENGQQKVKTRQCDMEKKKNKKEHLETSLDKHLEKVRHDCNLL